MHVYKTVNNLLYYIEELIVSISNTIFEVFLKYFFNTIITLPYIQKFLKTILNICIQ